MKQTKMGSKGERTKTAILNSTVHCLAQRGEADTTFQAIADHCQLPQPLVVYYLGRRTNIFMAAVEHILGYTLIETEKALAKSQDPEGQLKLYFEISLSFFIEQPNIGRIYSQFYSKSTYDPKFRSLNTKLKQEAVDRLSGLFVRILNKWNRPSYDVHLMAKATHNSLSGLLLNMISEQTVDDYQKLLGILFEGTLEALRRGPTPLN